jgi:hypothetical protein
MDFCILVTAMHEIPLEAAPRLDLWTISLFVLVVLDSGTSFRPPRTQVQVLDSKQHFAASPYPLVASFQQLRAY